MSLKFYRNVKIICQSSIKNIILRCFSFLSVRIGIIGGGIYGTAIAYFLSVFGDEETILFDQQEIGGESTSRSDKP